jgi:hypothetical protein
MCICALYTACCQLQHACIARWHAYSSRCWVTCITYGALVGTTGTVAGLALAVGCTGGPTDGSGEAKGTCAACGKGT